MNYVYIYERLGIPLYVGVGSDRSLKRARNVKSHRDFSLWCKEKFGGTRRVKVRIIAQDLTRKQALLIESVLIVEHAKHHDIFNRVVSIKLTEKYVAKYRKKNRYATEEEREEAAGASKRRRHDAFMSSDKGIVYRELKALYAKTPTGRGYHRLANNISYAKKHGKEFKHLEKERSKFLTFSQWKKTVEGVKALKKITESKYI